MGSNVARYGDLFIGNCSVCDGYPQVTGMLMGDTAGVVANGKKVSVLQGMGIGFCGHITTIVGGSSTVFAEGKGVARRGDSVANSIDGTIITGSANVFSG